ncbi:MAG: hypothetical protein AABP62_18825 [Planctomycetota bacterium]
MEAPQMPSDPAYTLDLNRTSTLKNLSGELANDIRTFAASCVEGTFAAQPRLIVFRVPHLFAHASQIPTQQQGIQTQIAAFKQLIDELPHHFWTRELCKISRPLFINTIELASTSVLHTDQKVREIVGEVLDLHKQIADESSPLEKTFSQTEARYVANMKERLDLLQQFQDRLAGEQQVVYRPSARPSVLFALSWLFSFVPFLIRLVTGELRHEVDPLKETDGYHIDALENIVEFVQRYETGMLDIADYSRHCSHPMLKVFLLSSKSCCKYIGEVKDGLKRLSERSVEFEAECGFRMKLAAQLDDVALIFEKCCDELLSRQCFSSFYKARGSSIDRPKLKLLCYPSRDARGGIFIAHCLNLDLVAHGNSSDDALNNLAEMVKRWAKIFATSATSESQQRYPFVAPAKYWRLFDDSAFNSRIPFNGELHEVVELDDPILPSVSPTLCPSN